MALQGVQQGGVKGGAVGIVFAADHSGFHAKAGGAFQRVDAGLAGDHQHDPAVGVLAAALGFPAEPAGWCRRRRPELHTRLHTSSTPSPSTMRAQAVGVLAVGLQDGDSLVGVLGGHGQHHANAHIKGVEHVMLT